MLYTMLDFLSLSLLLFHSSKKATRKGHVEVVRLLVQNGVSVNARTDFGKGQSVLNLAKDHHEEDSNFIQFLIEELGAIDIAEEDL